MRFVNETRYHAALLRSVIDERRIAASVVARASYDLSGPELTPSREQPYIVSEVPWVSPRGSFEGDLPFKRGGVDVFVFGHAVTPNGRPMERMSVTIRVGAGFRREVVILGPRVWRRNRDGLAPSVPGLFTTVPLTLASAYGGRSSWDGLALPWPDNPDGVGYYLSEREAEERPLPQIEDPQTLVRRWDDRPATVGLGICPPSNSQRLTSSLELDPERRRIVNVRPRFFNSAFPAMIAPDAAPGDRVALDGVHPQGRVEFQLPLRALRVHMRLGDRIVDRELTVDQIGVDVERGRVFVTYRFPFRYAVVARQRRAVTLSEGEA